MNPLSLDCKLIQHIAQLGSHVLMARLQIFFFFYYYFNMIQTKNETEQKLTVFPPQQFIHEYIRKERERVSW